MTEVENKIYNKIESYLDSQASYDDQHNFLQIAEFGKDRITLNQIYERYPAIQDKVSAYMLDSISSEFGNPSSNQFTFSKEISDQDLLGIISSMSVNKETIENRLKSQGFTGDIYRDLPTINNLMAERNMKFAEQSNVVNLSKVAADQLYTQEDWPVPLGYGPQLPLGYVMLAATNILGSMGKSVNRMASLYKEGHPNWFVDGFFERPGVTDNIHWNMLNLGIENRKVVKTDYSQDYKNAMRSLDAAYNELDDIKHNPKYASAVQMTEDLNEYFTLEKQYTERFKSTGADEALEYITGSQANVDPLDWLVEYLEMNEPTKVLLHGALKGESDSGIENQLKELKEKTHPDMGFDQWLQMYEAYGLPEGHDITIMPFITKDSN